jgi:hypothetical protein
VPSCALYRKQESAFSSHQEDQPKVPRRIRAMSGPERAENYGHPRSLTGTANGLRSGQVQVDPLRETTFQAAGRGFESCRAREVALTSGNAIVKLRQPVKSGRRARTGKRCPSCEYTFRSGLSSLTTALPAADYCVTSRGTSQLSRSILTKASRSSGSSGIGPRAVTAVVGEACAFCRWRAARCTRG